MNKKDYELLAQVLRHEHINLLRTSALVGERETYTARYTLNRTFERIAEALKHENPRFKIHLFRDAVYGTAENQLRAVTKLTGEPQ